MVRLPALSLALAALGCAGGTSGGALATSGDHYLRFVSYEVPVNEHVLLRWEERQMPLRVHLPPPPAGLASDPAAVWDAVRDGVTDWADVASPGVPSFRFVDDPGEADIPIVWEAESSGDWFIAHCVYDVNWAQRRFGVARILVTARYQGREAGLDELYVTVLHEMGHALGLTGHSPATGDVMHPNAQDAPELSARDRETLRLLYAKPIGTRVTGARSAD